MSFNTQCIKHSKLGSLSLNDIVYDLIILLIPLREISEIHNSQNNQTIKKSSWAPRPCPERCSFHFKNKNSKWASWPSNLLWWAPRPSALYNKIYNINVAAFNITVMSAAAFSQLLNIFKINAAALRTSVTNAATLSRLPQHYSRLSAAALALRAAALGDRPRRGFPYFFTKFHNNL